MDKLSEDISKSVLLSKKTTYWTYHVIEAKKRYVLEGKASNQVQRIIGQKIFLKSNINFIRQYFYQTVFKPISKRQFETSEAMRILNTHVISKQWHSIRNLFRVRLPYLLLIRSQYIFIPPVHYPLRDSRSIPEISPRYPQLTKII
jgi:hypothetical protein